MADSVFDRTGLDGPEVSGSTYNLVIGLVLLWGFAVNWYIVKTITPESIMHINMWVFLIGYFVSCFFGIFLFQKSDNPVISFIGYNFVVVPFGLIVNLAVSRYSPTIVSDAIAITGMVTLIMMILGTLFPAFFQKIAGVLTVSLIVVIIVQLVESFILKKHFRIVDWITALIFCGYIGYDWGRANNIPKTIDNAVDSAASIYMDIINLFLTILRILGNKR